LGDGLGEGKPVNSRGSDKQNRHRDGLREFSFEVPARRIAIVRKQCMDALGGLLDRVEAEAEDQASALLGVTVSHVCFNIGLLVLLPYAASALDG